MWINVRERIWCHTVVLKSVLEYGDCVEQNKSIWKEKADEKSTDSTLKMAVAGAGVSSPCAWASSQPRAPANKTPQVCKRLIICIREWYRLLAASTFLPFREAVSTVRSDYWAFPSLHTYWDQKKPCSTLRYAPSWHILLAQVNTCTFWIWSVGIVFAGKHSFSLSCKQDKKAKANVHRTGKTPACMLTWWTHLSACRFLLAPLSQQIPVDCLLIPANMPLVAFT